MTTQDQLNQAAQKAAEEIAAVPLGVGISDVWTQQVIVKHIQPIIKQVPEHPTSDAFIKEIFNCLECGEFAITVKEVFNRYVKQVRVKELEGEVSEWKSHYDTSATTLRETLSRNVDLREALVNYQKTSAFCAPSPKVANDPNDPWSIAFNKAQKALSSPAESKTLAKLKEVDELVKALELIKRKASTAGHDGGDSGIEEIAINVLAAYNQATKDEI